MKKKATQKTPRPGGDRDIGVQAHDPLIDSEEESPEEFQLPQHESLPIHMQNGTVTKTSLQVKPTPLFPL